MKTKNIVAISAAGLALVTGLTWWFSGENHVLTSSISQRPLSSTNDSNPLKPQDPNSPQAGLAADEISPGTFQADLQSLLGMISARLEDRKHKGKLTPADREKMEALRAQEKELEKKLHAELMASEDSRKAMLEKIMSEQDPKAKAALARLIHGLPPEMREPLEMQLTKSEDPANRKEGVRGLTTVGTESSLKTIVGIGQKDDAMDVRSTAVREVGRSLLMTDSPSERYQSIARTELRNFTKVDNPPQVRIAAFQTMTTQKDISAADQKMLTNVINTEKDPAVRRAAVFAKNVTTARQGKGALNSKTIAR